jgi:hypothetical protein
MGNCEKWESTESTSESLAPFPIISAYLAGSPGDIQDLNRVRGSCGLLERGSASYFARTARHGILHLSFLHPDLYEICKSSVSWSPAPGEKKKRRWS